MANTLDIDDDWGPIDIVRSLERAFDIKLADEEVRDIFTVGELYDLLCARLLGPQRGEKCASAMAFYRLRCVLADLRRGSKLAPDSDLSFLEQGGAKRSWKRLEAASGLSLPPLSAARQWPLGVAAAAMVMAIPAAVAGLVLALLDMPFGEPLLHGAPALLLGGALSAVVVAAFDPGKLPDEARTLGDLAAKVALRNYGRFAKAGAVLDQIVIWQVMLEAFSDHTALPLDQVRRDTTFLKPSKKRAA